MKLFDVIISRSISLVAFFFIVFQFPNTFDTLQKLELAVKEAIPQGSVKDVPAGLDSISPSHAVAEEYVSKRKMTPGVWKEFKRKKIDNKWKAECIR